MSQHKEATWRSRIVDSGEVDPTTLISNPRNWRLHPTSQQAAIRGVLSDVGWVARVIVNRTTGHLIDGHLRVEQAIAAKAKTVPVDYVELDEREEAIVLVTLDPIGAMATTERERLDSVIRAAQSTDADVQRCIAEIAEREKVILGSADTVPKDQRSGSSPWDRVEASDRVRCVIGDMEFGVAKDDAARWIDQLRKMECDSLREAAEQWFSQHLQ